MQKSLAHNVINVVINALRFTLALVFVFSGFVKAVDPMGVVYKMSDYAEAFGWVVHPALLWIGACGLIILEYVMGVALFFGFYRRFYLTMTILFLGMMTPLTLILAITNPISDCGCFGDAVVLTNWQTFGKNALLLIMAIVALIYNRRIRRIVSERTQWLVFIYALVSVVVFMEYNLRHLPGFDFRPYSIGTNIINDMTIPDDAPQSEYETLFVLEKDGEQHTFTFDNYPDSTWTFVRRESRLISEGYTPPIKDFHLLSLEGEDLTLDVLEEPGYTFLMVARNLERTNEGMLDIINDLYDYAKVNGYPFYMLTSSNEDVIDRWTEHTGSAYPYLQADEILLKTMLRANLGLIILHDAVVTGKWSARDLPRDEQLGAAIEHNRALTISSHTLTVRRATMIFGMFLPLLLLSVIYRKRE